MGKRHVEVIGVALVENDQLGAFHRRVMQVDEIVLGFAYDLLQIGVERFLGGKFADGQGSLQLRLVEAEILVVDAEQAIERRRESDGVILAGVGPDGVVPGTGARDRRRRRSRGYGRRRNRVRSPCRSLGADAHA